MKDSKTGTIKPPLKSSSTLKPSSQKSKPLYGRDLAKDPVVTSAPSKQTVVGSVASPLTKIPSPPGPTEVPGSKLLEVEVLMGESGGTEAGFHQMGDGMGCNKEYQYRYIRGIHVPARNTPDHFAVGSQLHAGKARWFSKHFATDAKTWASVQMAMRMEMDKEKLPVTQKALQMGERYMREYIEHWSKRPKPTPIACEYKLGPTALEKGDPFFMWRTARLDDVSRYPEALGKLCIGETKTTSDTIPSLIAKYELHAQLLLQMLLWKMDPLGEAKFGTIAGVMLDVVRKSYDEKPSQFQRHFISVPQFAMTWFPRALKAHLRALAPIDWDFDALRNPSRCTRKEGRMLVSCEFKPLCLHGRNASNKYVLGKGESLLSWKPGPGKVIAPWE